MFLQRDTARAAENTIQINTICFYSKMNQQSLWCCSVQTVSSLQDAPCHLIIQKKINIIKIKLRRYGIDYHCVYQKTKSIKLTPDLEMQIRDL